MTKENYWAEISNEYISDIDNGFQAVYIDAWKTGEDDEEGKVIAKVYGKWIADEAHVFVDYLNVIASSDKMAQEIIEEAKIKLIRELTPPTQ